MKMPEKVKTICPKCKKHTMHEIERVRGGKRGELKWGQRRFRRAIAGYGGFPRALPDRNKPTKRVYIRYRCLTCKKAHQRKCQRSKKFEIKGG